MAFVERPLILALAIVLCDCAGAGPYGHAAHYVELDDETAAAVGARDYDPVMAQKEPEQWRRLKVSLFGVVESRQAGPGGQTRLKLSVRRLEPRNLCEMQSDEDSCRVTVSDTEFGVAVALVSLHGEDEAGARSVGAKSLLRLIGTIEPDTSPSGAPVLRATWYRHWPAFYYVTRASAREMRQ